MIYGYWRLVKHDCTAQLTKRAAGKDVIVLGDPDNKPGPPMMVGNHFAADSNAVIHLPSNWAGFRVLIVESD